MSGLRYSWDESGTFHYGPGFEDSARGVYNRDVSVTIGFRKRISSSTTVAGFQKELEFVWLEHISLPGLVYDPIWIISPVSEDSNFKKDVEVISFKNGALNFTVKTKFNGIHASMDFVYVTCFSRPGGTYFDVKESLNGEINIFMCLCRFHKI